MLFASRRFEANAVATRVLKIMLDNAETLGMVEEEGTIAKGDEMKVVAYIQALT